MTYMEGIYMGLRDFFNRGSKRQPDDEKQELRKEQAKPQVQGQGEPPIGGHWGILCNTPKEVQEMCMKAAAKGTRVGATPLEGRNAHGLLMRDGVFQLICIATDVGQILTFYPMVEGKKHRVVFNEAFPCNPAFEGDIELSMGPATFTVFDTGYFQNHAKYQAGENYDFALSGIAYNLIHAGDDKVKDKDGRELSLKGMAGFFPVKSGAPAEYAFRSPVKAVDRLEANGRQLLRLTIPLFRLPEEDAAYGDVDIYLYVRQDRLNGYEPAVGDDVSGVMWLQGYLV